MSLRARCEQNVVFLHARTRAHPMLMRAHATEEPAERVC